MEETMKTFIIILLAQSALASEFRPDAFYPVQVGESEDRRFVCFSGEVMTAIDAGGHISCAKLSVSVDGVQYPVIPGPANFSAHKCKKNEVITEIESAGNIDCSSLSVTIGGNSYSVSVSSAATSGGDTCKAGTVATALFGAGAGGGEVECSRLYLKL
jgi:hypothetical protein